MDIYEKTANLLDRNETLSETDLVKFLKNKLGKVSSKKVEESVSVVYEKAASMLVKEIYLAESKRDTEEFKEDLKNEYIKEFKNSMDEKSGLDFSLETALYWFANDYHSGQNDIWYSVLSTSDYRPGRSEKSVEDTEDMWAENFYEWLKKRFTGKKKNISEAKSDKDPFEEAVLDSAEKIFKEFKGIRWREFISLILKDLHWNANNFSKVVYVLNPYYGLGKNEIVYEK